MSIKIAGLSSLVEQMKYSEIALRDNNRRLAQKNDEMEKQRRKTRQLVRQHRASTVKHGVERAAKKMARAGVAMIPVVGISAVAAATADDIHDLCLDIRAARELEVSLYGEESLSTEDEQIYCHQYLAERLAILAEGHRERIARNFGISYEALTNQAENMKESMRRITDGIINAPYQEEFERQYQYILDYWSQKPEGLSDDPVAVPTDSSTAERAELFGEY